MKMMRKSNDIVAGRYYLYYGCDENWQGMKMKALYPDPSDWAESWVMELPEGITFEGETTYSMSYAWLGDVPKDIPEVTIDPDPFDMMGFLRSI